MKGTRKSNNLVLSAALLKEQADTNSTAPNESLNGEIQKQKSPLDNYQYLIKMKEV